MREPAAGTNLMKRHHLNRYDTESWRTLRRGISHFLSPQLRVLIKEKPRIVLSEKAEFSELLSEPPSGRPIQELSVDLMRRSFMIRRKVPTGAAVVAASEDDESSGRPAVPLDVPMDEQTTNHLSSAYAKKSNQLSQPRPGSDNTRLRGRLPARSRPTDDEQRHAPPSNNVKTVVKPLIAKLMAMKWAGWGNPFSVVIKRSNAPLGYFDIVKRPMNLTYIRDNLNRNSYPTVRKVEDDLDLLVNNALAFNRPSDPVYQQALELRAAYRAELPMLKSILERDQARARGGGEASRQLDKKPRIR
ncbi:unnamed protein product [Ascophyllum nodosum]